MIKLAIFDKDGTLVKPASGREFIQHPEDQMLRPGVARKLASLRAAGVQLAIASNQGGCASFEVTAENVKVGMWLHVGRGMSEEPMSWHRVTAVEVHEEDPTLPPIAIGLTEFRYMMLVYPGTIFTGRWKSVEDAIAEMKFAMNLTGIKKAAFCPSAAKTLGDRVILLEFWANQWMKNEFGVENVQDTKCPVPIIGFRKPQNGMLCMLAETTPRLRGSQRYKKILMVGDRPEDEAAAKAAGVNFEWADTYFEGSHK